MPLTESMTLCQYCEHMNRADARFCVGCGAQLHLVPCPTCGAVNDKTAKSCYQCHGELRASTDILVQRLPAEDVTNAVSAGLTPPDATPPPRQRQPLFVVLIIFAAFTSAAFFAYRQRIDPDRKLPVDNVNRAIAPAKANEPGASIGAINKAALAVTTPATTISMPPAPLPLNTKPDAPSEASLPSATAPVEPPAVVARQRGNRRAVQSATANPPETAAAPVSGIEKKAPPINACTEAIAALGLCNPTPTKGK